MSEPATPPIRPLALFETHLPVADLDRSLAFYRNVLGFELAHRSAPRQVAFLWVGGRGQGVLGLWGGSASPSMMRLHLGFRVDLSAVLAAFAALPAHGVEPLDLWERPTGEPSVIAWAPAASVFFRDPDGHLVELLAMLPEAPRPEAGNLGWSAWRALGPGATPPA